MPRSVVPIPDDPVFTTAAALAARKQAYEGRLRSYRAEVSRRCEPLNIVADYKSGEGDEAFVKGWAAAFVAAARAIEELGLCDLLDDIPDASMPIRMARAALKRALQGKAEAKRAAQQIFENKEHQGGVRPALLEIAHEASKRLWAKSEADLREEFPDLAPPLEAKVSPSEADMPSSPKATSAAHTYDPSDREPRTFSELVSWMGYWAAFSSPRRTGLAAPTIAHNADHHYLESYCTDEFEAFDLNSLVKLRARYMRQTGMTVEQIDATTLREMADHFRSQNCQGNSASTPNSGSAGQKDPEIGIPVGKCKSGVKKPKKSTRRGEGREKVIAALNVHHKYSNGSVGNTEPISVNDLAHEAGDVSTSTPSYFFKREFGIHGHTKYMALCRRNTSKLLLWLKQLNGDLQGQEFLFGRQPADEDDRSHER